MAVEAVVITSPLPPAVAQLAPSWRPAEAQQESNKKLEASPPESNKPPQPQQQSEKAARPRSPRPRPGDTATISQRTMAAWALDTAKALGRPGEHRHSGSKTH